MSVFVLDKRKQPLMPCSEKRARKLLASGRAFGRPCPGVQEWMMGWPEGWSDTKPLETAKYQSWLRRLCGHWRMLTANAGGQQEAACGRSAGPEC